MQVEQAIYTSCMRGIEDGRGVCLYSMSRSLEKISKIRFEKNSTYQKDYKNTSDVESLPINYFCGIDETGSFYIQQIKSILDYGGGRQGNVMSHMLLVKGKEETLSKPPICYYRSNDLVEQIPLENVSSPERPEYLPVLRDIEMNPNLTFENISEFINQRGFDSFMRLMTLMIKAKGEKKRMVICDEPDNIVRWIAAIQYALPAGINRNIAFSTYTYDFEIAPYDICGYIKGVSKTQDLQSNTRIYYFSPTMSSNTIVEENGWFSNLKMAFLLGDLGYIQRFNDFLMSKNYTDLDEDIYLAYDIYNLLDSAVSFEKHRFSTDKMSKFIMKWMTEEERCQIIYNILKVPAVDINEVGKFCSELLLKSDYKNTLYTLNKVDSDLEKEGNAELNEKLITGIWRVVLTQYSKKHPKLSKSIHSQLKENIKRDGLLLQIEMDTYGDEPFDGFKRNYEYVKKAAGEGDQEALLQIVDNYIQYLQGHKRESREERWARYAQLLQFTISEGLQGPVIEKLISITNEDFPITDSEINDDSKKLKKGREEKITREYENGVVLNLHQLAGNILNYKIQQASTLDIPRVDLYLMGFNLWKGCVINGNFDYMKHPSIIRDYYAANPIDVRKISEIEFEEFLEWVCDVFVMYIFTEERLQFIDHCFVMTENQKGMLIETLFDAVHSNKYSKKKDTPEIAVMVTFCMKEEYREYISGITRCMEKMSSRSFSYLDEYMEEKIKGDKKLLEVWEHICENMDSRAGGFRKLFGKKNE